MQKAKSVAGQNNNEALRVLQTVSLYLTGNMEQDINDKDTYTNNTSGMQKARSYITVKVFGKTITLATFYFPSGTLKVKGYHTMNENGVVTSSSTAIDVPLKGVKMHFLTWFYWGHTYTDENGYYQASESYLLDPIHTIYFSGRTKNQQNSWDLDRVWLWGSCLWVQKHCLGEQSKDVYNATIDVTSDAWDACITNNAFYEYMTICDKEGLTRPPSHLQVALRVNLSGSSSAPLFQNHTNTFTTSVLAGFFTSTFITGGSTAPATVVYIAFLNSLPDILLSAGNIEEYQNYGYSRKSSLNEYYSTIWHELSHSSNLQRVISEKGYWTASDFWSQMIGTEVGHSVASGHPYGAKGDTNWQQVALCEGWAYYRGWQMARNYLNYTPNSSYESSFPYDYQDMFNELFIKGCSLTNMEKCLTVKTLAEYKSLLTNIYSFDAVKVTNINVIVNKYYNKTY
ncbi:MAG: hypothetical protein BGO29_08095 [Bacteroidales bacterium 36-12]|nr:MAG: hypothetical protein BGO29_08095 [Bacteroidales bacterium 36-12]